jgi:hypothetical protein
MLEDSPQQPFAGIYQTYMLPNNAPDLQTRLLQLVSAIKRVWASTFSRRAKEFLEMTSFRMEEEKMAVIIQEVVGKAHGNRYYPDFSGVARSHDFYPTAPIKAEDGIAAVALGLGEAVVGGDSCLRFCPRYPRHVMAFSSVDEALRNSQREFFALDLGVGDDAAAHCAELRRWELADAEADGVLAHMGSTYSPDNDVIYDGISRPGVRVVSFAPILKHRVFPLADLLEAVLELGKEGTSAEVEIEFAGNLGTADEEAEFGFLQLRPLAMSSELEELEIGHVLSSRLLCRSSNVLGNGRVSSVRDLVVVDYHRFDRLRSSEVAQHVAQFNAELQRSGTPYVLIGVGRWGSADPYLGIPVTWNQIAGARVIVESGFRDFHVAPSQGTHFFQNITSCHVGYFTVNPETGEGFVDWEWIDAQPVAGNTEFVRHVRLDEPLEIKMSGKNGEGVILKPESEEAS